LSVSVTGPLAFAVALSAALAVPIEANSAAAATKPTTLLRIVLLSIISVKDRLQHHRSMGSNFPVQLRKSCNHNDHPLSIYGKFIL
jgi:hypothetical protein